MLRDLVLTSCILVCLGLTYRYHFVGVLTWAWVALMQPNHEVYGVVSSALRVNLLVAVVTLIAWMVSKDKKMPRADAIVVVVLIFLAWMTFNEFFAVFPEGSWYMWNGDWRIIALGLVVWTTANSRDRIHALIWVVVASFLYFGVKDGILTILEGGIKKTMGPNGGMYADNNQFAAALLMILPLINYLRVNSANYWVRIGLAAGLVLTVFAIVGSYSRGAFVGLVALGFIWWFRSRNKLFYPFIAAAIAYSLFNFMPQSYHDRLTTLNDADSDASFQGRVIAWKVAYYYARDHFPIGAGLDGPQQPSVFNYYFPRDAFHAAHSIFFQVLGDLGFMGLAIYLVLFFLIFVACFRIGRIARSRPEFDWARDLARAIQLSMVAFCVAGSALSLAYCDLLFIYAGVLPRLWSLVAQREGAGPYRVPAVWPVLAAAEGT
jgi:probable O-glycosylation ligase (exosortase A-associated)